MFTELYREEKREEGDRCGQEDKERNQKERDQFSQWNTQRVSQSWVEKRRGREEIEVTWWSKRTVQAR